MNIYLPPNTSTFRMQVDMLLQTVALLLVFTSVDSELISIEKDDLTLKITESTDRLLLTLLKDGSEKLAGNLGLSTNLENATPCEGDISNCFNFGDVQFQVESTIENAFTLTWSSSNTKNELMDCFNLNRETTNWFGGPEQWNQYWPIEKLELDNFANLPKEQDFAAIVEPYWLNSRGAYVFVNGKTPLFIHQNASRDDVCFNAKVEAPFAYPRPRVLFSYTIAARDDAKQGHLHAIEYFLGKPSGHPDRRIIEKPIWSTWARYKKPINDTVLREFANEIISNEFPTGQFEIDDNWETCYGSLTFRTPEFSDIDETVRQIKELGFTVSLWTHPFVNLDCDYTEIGLQNNYFAKNMEGSVLTTWWNSYPNESQHIDFSNPDAKEWFVSRLKLLQENHGIDSFKFDAGETSWVPQVPDLTGDVETSPSHITETFVRMCAEFGGLIEVRTGWGTQDLPVLVRMIDKDSRWGNNNGLRTLITTLLQMNMNGYVMALPDMIGGNGYIWRPTAELFVRWLQANTFMPSIQFSYVPWDFEADGYSVTEISKKYVELHSIFAEEIIKAMEKSISSGYPVNPPIWWVDPLNSEALKEDTEFMLGEDILVAPVVDQKAVTRNVYLPVGAWVDANTDELYDGGKVLRDYPAPIEVLPYFVRVGSNAEKIYREKVLKRT